MYQAQLQLILQSPHQLLTTTLQGSYYFHFMNEWRTWRPGKEIPYGHTASKYSSVNSASQRNIEHSA